MSQLLLYQNHSKSYSIYEIFLFIYLHVCTGTNFVNSVEQDGILIPNEIPFPKLLSDY